MTHAPPIPGRKPQALTLAPGNARTAWPDLDPTARLALLAEVLAINPGLTLSGGIDEESPLEPLLINAAGDLIALDGSRAGNPLDVEVFAGGVLAERVSLGFLALAVVGAVLIIGR